MTKLGFKYSNRLVRVSRLEAGPMVPAFSVFLLAARATSRSVALALPQHSRAPVRPRCPSFGHRNYGTNNQLGSPPRSRAFRWYEGRPPAAA